MSDKPAVLILGGTGFVGRHLVKYLIDNNLASKIRVADKQLPITSYLNPVFKAAFDNPIVEFKQANLSNPASIKKIFTVEDNSYKFTYVVNLAAETRYGQEESVYKQHVYDLSVNCAKEALAQGVSKYVEVSTAQVYEAGNKPSVEKDKLKPWTKLAKFKYQAEEEIKKLKDLPFVILRPAIIYGPADLNGLAARITCATTYTQTKEKMKLLWTGEMRIDVVNVNDVVRAIWTCFEKAKPGSIYNLADKSQLTQKKLNDIFTELFGIDTGFWGTALSSVASLNLKSAAETANDTHMMPWSDMCKNSNIKSTPLSPYIDVELLYNTPLSIDGSAIEKDLGFKYETPNITSAEIVNFINYWKDLGLFPNYTKLSK